MGDKVELNIILDDLDTWSTADMLILRSALIGRLKQADDLSATIHSMAKEFALQALNNSPEAQQIQNEITMGQAENGQNKLELESLKEHFQEENNRKNLWLQEYVRKVEHGEAELKQLERVLPWDMLGTMERPSGTDHLLPPGDDWQDIEWINTQIGVSLFFRNSGNPRTIRVWTVKGIFDGQLDEAYKEIVPQILYAIFRIPSISDFSGKPTWLEDKEALIVLKTLTYYKYIQPSKFNKQQLAIFNELWKRKKDSAYQGVRKNAMDSFTKFVERTFNQREERVSQTILSP
ncbi:MAG: hypothetical protein ABI947_02930 [Chloroflexota bacterium]